VAEETINIPPGLVAVTTHGSLESGTAQCLIRLQKHFCDMGLSNTVTFDWVYEALVDKARNEVCRKALENPQIQWVWMLDGDMIFEPHLADHMLRTAFHDCPWADVVGGYCQLKNPPYLPTIDRGSGQWESVDANVGPIEVIRTGGACLLIKRHVFEQIAYPWFGVRYLTTPIDHMAELDGYARQRFDGRNPFAELDEWEQLKQCASEDHIRMRNSVQSVGEDSNFTDTVKAAGMRIVVDTHAVCGHRDRKTIWPKDHQDEIRRGEERHNLLHGVLS